VALSFENGAWWIEDQDSRNGTILYPTTSSSKRVQDRPEKIRIGDVIQIGDTRLRLNQ
jgi:pSer/pThr/pTyr-binding forkhead associated (FHA) protein